MSDRILTLHIGLPKTATTFLQHWIFKPALGPGFIHRTRGDRAKRICRYVKELPAAATQAEARSLRRKLRSSLEFHCDRFPDVGSILISDENISGRAIEFWRGKGPGPRRVAKRLAALGRDLASQFAAFRILIGVRRQDQWLASRYAESSTVFDEFGQADFDRRMADLSERYPLGPVFDWLDLHKVHTTFADVLGPQNLLMISLERLRSEPEKMLADIGAFVGEPLVSEVYRKLIDEDVGVIRNKLSAGDDTWQLRRDGSPLRLSKDLQQAILSRLADSNRALDELIRLKFD